MPHQSAPSDALASWRAKPLRPTTAAQRGVDTFVRGAVLARAVYAVVGTDGIAAVTSPSDEVRATYLFWSNQTEADRWADLLAKEPRVLAIDLAAFLAVTLPEMARHNALAGADWSSEPIEIELDPAGLAAHLRDELARDFAFNAGKARLVFVLERDGEITSIETPDARVVTPLWADRQLAESAVAAIADPGLTLVRKPLLEITGRYLLSPAGVRAELSPGYVHAAGALKMSPWALKALLNSGGRSATRIAAVS